MKREIFSSLEKIKVEGPFVLKAAAFVKVCWVKCSYLLVLPAKGLFIRLGKVANVTMHLGHPKTYKKKLVRRAYFSEHLRISFLVDFFPLR